jgi:thiosulfate reductase/polysulfide reductase chain A
VKITRRQFLKGSATTTAIIGLSTKSHSMELALGNQSYDYIKRGTARDRIFTCSPLYPHDNPLEAWIDDDPMAPANLLTGAKGRRVVELSGITESVRSRGRLSAAEASAWMQLDNGDRLQRPLKRVGARGAGQWKEVSWQEAQVEIAAALKSYPGAETALLVGKDTSAGAWDRFMRTMASNTVIALSSTANRQAAWQQAWGEGDSIPDLAHTHYVLNFGSNFFVTFPDYAADAMDGRMLRRAKIVTFDPRCSKTAGLSDEWVPIRPGTDGLVALAMVNYLLAQGWTNEAAITKLSNLSVPRLRQELKQYSLEHAEEVSGVPALTIRRIAREFAESGRGCIVSGAGTSGHANGFDTERALMLLPLVMGYIEIRGGNCLPREIQLGRIEPVPSAPDMRNPAEHPYRFPADAGKRYPVGVLFGYNTNPAFDAPAAALWRNVLADEHRVKLFVAIGTFRNETFELADLILPEAHWLERNEPVQGSGSLLPWVSLRQRTVDPPGQVKELREILRDIVLATGDADKTRYWQFTDTQSWMDAQLDGIADLKREGGARLMAKHSGVWPTYGYLHPELRRIVNEEGEEVLPKYGARVKLKLDPFPHWKQPADTAAANGDLILLVHGSDYHAGDASANDKIIMETTLANHVHINFKTAQGLGISDGDLVRVASKAGYLVTHAHVTETVRPDVVAMHRDGGHWAIGGIASGNAGPEHEDAPSNLDADVARNLWWTDIGVHPMDIILPSYDEVAGGPASGTSVRVSKGLQGDIYGTVKIDLSVLSALDT